MVDGTLKKLKSKIGLISTLRLTLLHSLKNKKLSKQEISNQMKTRSRQQIYSYYNKNKNITRKQYGFFNDSKYAYDNFENISNYFEKKEDKLKQFKYIKFHQKTNKEISLNISEDLLKIILSNSNKDQNENIKVLLNAGLLQTIYLISKFDCYIQNTLKNEQK
jgi:hypothetical protein